MTNGVKNREVLSRGQRLAVAASRIRADLAFAVLDIFVVVAAYTLGLAIRMLDPLVGDPADLWADLALAVPAIVLIHIIANVIAGAYGHVWEHASTSEAARVVVANASAVSVLALGNMAIRTAEVDVVIPWIVFAIGGLVSLFAMGLVRFRSRLFSIHRLAGARRVLVVGTGRDAVAFARQAPHLDGRRVIGFLSTHASGNGNGSKRLAGLQVLGDINEIATVVEDQAIDEVVVVGGDSKRARKVVDLCLDVDVSLRLLPATEEVLRDGVSAVDVRDIRVEDLLERQPVATDLAAVRSLLEGKRVLVTGAGGSIGAEVVRQVAEFNPGALCALDRDETLLHEGRLHWPPGVSSVIADVRDADRILRVFERFKPDVVFHAAALKHVPVLEEFPEEAVLTNVVGTKNVIEAGSRCGMQRFVLISTDKAVAPTSVMGATKRAAELMTQAGTERRDGCVYAAVRFGNVLGSRGSVIPTFIDQIKAGGPVTVTDRAMTRYFMTVDEAVQLVLQASSLASGSVIYLLDMGEPIRIEALARRLIRLAGLSPDKDIEIRFTGRRPGEKLTEILALDQINPTTNDKVFEVRLDHPQAHVVIDKVMELEKMALEGDTERVIALLRELTGADLLAENPVIDAETGSQAAVSWS